MRIPQGVYVDTRTGEVLSGKRIANHLDMSWNADDAGVWTAKASEERQSTSIDVLFDILGR